MTRGDVDIKSLTRFKVEYPNSMFSGHSTYTTLFMLPAFDIHLDDKTYKLFVNSYIDDTELKHEYNRPLFLLLKAKVDNLEEFKKIEQAILQNKNFTYVYPVGTDEDSYLFMYVLECPKRFSSDYDLFLQSKYSLFSPDYKNRFHKTVPTTDGKAYEESPLYGVLFKTEFFKKKIENLLTYINKKADVNSPIILSPTQEYFGEIKPAYEIFRYKP